jgi:hypothetical protein
MLMLGVVPIVERSRMDVLWEEADLPVLPVTDLLELPSEEELEAIYHERFGSKIATDFKRGRLSRKYWLAELEGLRKAHLQHPELKQRRRCWHGLPNWQKPAARAWAAGGS